jgi:hypothetical protein
MTLENYNMTDATITALGSRSSVFATLFALVVGVPLRILNGVQPGRSTKTS